MLTQIAKGLIFFVLTFLMPNHIIAKTVISVAIGDSTGNGAVTLSYGRVWLDYALYTFLTALVLTLTFTTINFFVNRRFHSFVSYWGVFFLASSLVLLLALSYLVFKPHEPQRIVFLLVCVHLLSWICLVSVKGMIKLMHA